MVIDDRTYCAVMTGRDYVAVARMIDRARMIPHDREAQTRLERRAARRLELVRRDVKDDGTGRVWARTDIAAGQGLVRSTQGHARDAVAATRTHIKEMNR
ncbi:MAG: hypothetical protein ACTH2Y_10570 [Corynebacterium sp.]|uniref:hypothetical protein n=1 Tax=Corynebacterium sp. TaxID=1720 RepID=UPI003F922F1F